jgi:cell division protein FtsI (penicillin-binding protein 3)
MTNKFKIFIDKISNYFQFHFSNHNSLFAWGASDTGIKIRILVVLFGFVACFVLISCKLLIISNNNSRSSKTALSKGENFRKEILDRNGTLLAVNLPSSSLFANPAKVIDAEKSIEKLSKVLGNLDKSKLLSELKSNKSFVWIKRDLTPKEQADVFNLGLPGFDFEREQKRIYTFGNLFSHIIGYVGRDFNGLAGIEKQFDEFLTNRDPITKKEDKNKPLVLSIDVRLQTILNEEIERIMREFRAKGAVGIIADPNNGEVLAMISKPDFDPHHPNNAKPEELFNMASLGVIETGSVFKALTIAVGFDTNIVRLNDAYDTSYMKIGKFQLKDYHPMKGWHSVAEIFMHSSNIGVAQIILEVGKVEFKRYLKNLGLLDQLQIELPERGRPLFPSDSRWNDLSMATMSYGYALSISPLHFVQATIPVVNGGKMYPLTLLKKEPQSFIEGTRVFSEETSKNMKKLLRGVVQNGNSKKAEVKGYLVGGKTGTAEILLNGRYIKNARRSSFLGIMPANDPKYIIYIWFDEPKGNKESFGFATAGWTAAPAVGRVFERMVTLYGMEPVDELSPEVQDIINIQYKIEDEI